MSCSVSPPSRRPALIRLVVGLALVLATSSCATDLILTVGGIDVTPNPATEGDQVFLVFTLIVLPRHEFTVIATIDGTEHGTVTRTAQHDGLFDMSLGSFADLVTAYGAGTHTAEVTVRIDALDRAASTPEVTFELVPPPTVR